ncbi:methionyl-tRNA formyltransferase [Salimicrobium halophilum]|uniref:Methionyl-tRNA formyltransferase n=1 Tax=Salimicrobium halophilum TaxID=86666 RepID=A0A1G8V2Y8_9BACI|nr:formyltransferase family protein [Salimicrobium halophilum]SDJ60391.1 methionyl-tRNA formyltransferase [Salimicrobium halophilum]
MTSLIFCGFGKLGQDCLNMLKEHGYTITYIFTHKEKEVDSVDTFAEKNGIPYSYEDMRKNEQGVIDKLLPIAPEYLVSVNYRYIIPKNIFDIPIYAFNIHGSLLPAYRGRTPHVWSIIHGQSKAGITSHLLEETVDTGDVIEQWEVPIDKEDTGYLLLQKYEKLYPRLLLRSLKKLENREPLLVQDETRASFYGKRTPDMGYIDFYKSGEDVRNFVRAQANPYPGAYYFLNDGRKIIIHELEVINSISSDSPSIGIVYTTGDTYYVHCKDSCLKIISYEIRKG